MEALGLADLNVCDALYFAPYSKVLRKLRTSQLHKVGQIHMLSMDFRCKMESTLGSFETMPLFPQASVFLSIQEEV